jgi:hypothetical protein
LSKKEETIMEMRSYTIPNSKLDTHSETDKNVTFSDFTIQVFADNNMISRFFNNKNFSKERFVEQERRNDNGNENLYHSKLEIGYAQ